MKKITVLTTGILCAASLAIGASASGVIEKIQAELRPDFEIVYEGDKQNFKNANGEQVYPILYEGSTYLPIRAVSEMINKEVTWYEADKRIEIADAPEITVTDADNIVVEDTTNKDDKHNRPADESEMNKQPEKKPQKDDKDKNRDEISSDIKISEEDASAIALEKAGLGSDEVENFKIELDDGVYEIEFKTDEFDYEAKISPVDGTIFEWEIDD